MELWVDLLELPPNKQPEASALRGLAFGALRDPTAVPPPAMIKAALVLVGMAVPGWLLALVVDWLLASSRS